MSGLVVTPHQEKPLLAIGLMLSAYLFFSCIDVSAKWLGIAGLSFLQITFMRYAGHFVISLGIILSGGIERERFGTPQAKLVVLRSVSLLSGTLLNFLVLQYLPLTLVSTIIFSAPIIACALSGPLLGEKIGKWRWAAIFAGFVGVIIAMRPFDASFHWSMLLSFGTAITFACYIILTRRLTNEVPTDTLQLYVGGIGTLVLLPVVIGVWQNPVNPTDWLVMFFIGVFGWTGHQLMTRAQGYAEVGRLMPFSYALLVYMALWGYFLFDDVPDRWTLSGAAIIVSANLIIWLRERHRSAVRTVTTDG